MPRFRRVGRLTKGYHTRQVDAYVARVEVAINGHGVIPEVTAAQIRKAGFDLVRNGYNVSQVDTYLDKLEQRAIEAEAATRPYAPEPDTGGNLALLRSVLNRPLGDRAARAPRLSRGYHPREVDTFLDQVAHALDGEVELSADEVRSVVFHARRGGYSEDAIDDLLDQVVEVLLRQSV
jgi:DivIVA domain-containing protein